MFKVHLDLFPPFFRHLYDLLALLGGLLALFDGLLGSLGRCLLSLLVLHVGTLLLVNAFFRCASNNSFRW